MRPTRRGWAALAVATAAVVLAGVHGPRALNAVAAPLFGAVAFGAVQVWRANEPEVDCRPVEPGFPGSNRTHRIRVTGGGVLDLRQPWPDGLEGDGIDAVVTGTEVVEAGVTFQKRGRYEVGAPTITQRDGLGLVGARYETDEATTIVVYPEIRRGAGPGVFAEILDADGVAERQAFDRLREYVPGDPLRDVHWKSSAKGEGFVVAEYERSGRTAAITIAATAEPGAVEAMATAAGTLAILALESGLSVGLRLPGRAISPGAGRDHESTILAALAGATHGSVDETGADVGIHATAAETRVRIRDTTARFEDLIGTPATKSAEEVAPT